MLMQVLSKCLNMVQIPHRRVSVASAFTTEMSHSLQKHLLECLSEELKPFGLFLVEIQFSSLSIPFRMILHFVQPGIKVP